MFRFLALFVVLVCLGGGAVLTILPLQQTTAESCTPVQAAGSFTSLTPHRVSVNPAGLTVQGAPMTQEQARNASIILGTVVAHNLGENAAKVALITTIVESWTRNLDWGHSSSLGLYQQIAAWGAAEERRDPVIATEMFLFGGRRGQTGLTDIAGWENLPPGRAAQAVQRSAHPDRYAKWVHEAEAIIRSASSQTTQNTALFDGSVAPQPRITNLDCLATSPDGIVFPVAATKQVIEEGVIYSGGRWVWDTQATTNYHHDYMAADIHAPVGTPVVAARSGRVISVNDTNVGCSNPTHPILKYRVPRVTILGDDGLMYYYTHLRPGSLEVDTGQTVTAGHPLGTVGPGECAQNTGPHLHIHASRGIVRSTEDPSDRAKMIDIQPLLVRAFNAIGRPPGIESGLWHPPLSGNPRITSVYGMRVNPVTGRYELHDGTDLSARGSGTVMAALGGKVLFSGFNPEKPWRGNYVELDHGIVDECRTLTRYHHMHRTLVRANDIVRAGDDIGDEGETGTATGPHVHFTIVRCGKTVDPVSYYRTHGRPIL